MIMLKFLLWFFTDRCGNCGGKIEVFSVKNAYCIDCGEKN